MEEDRSRVPDGARWNQRGVADSAADGVDRASVRVGEGGDQRGRLRPVPHAEGAVRRRRQEQVRQTRVHAQVPHLRYNNIAQRIDKYARGGTARTGGFTPWKRQSVPARAPLIPWASWTAAVNRQRQGQAPEGGREARAGKKGHQVGVAVVHRGGVRGGGAVLRVQPAAPRRQLPHADGGVQAAAEAHVVRQAHRAAEHRAVVPSVRGQRLRVPAGHVTNRRFRRG
eukprot:1179528-Prorocentrum_minimum.AAC.2